MVLSFIDLKNFRLHSNTRLEFSKNINYIVGGNGQGKTSLLEAIYYLCTTKNLNQASDIEAISFENEFFEINGKFTEFSNNKVRILFERETNKKNVFLDEKQIYRASNLIGKFPVVALLQSDHAITQGSPAERRRFVDSIISQSSATYLKLLLDYNRILRQRSSLLSKIKELNSPELFDQLEVWTNSLIKVGSEVISHRNSFVSEFNEFIQKPYEFIMGVSEFPKIKYSTISNGNSVFQIEENFKEECNKVKNDELKRARNLAGPHRDDFEFYINNLELKKYGSQGQNKTFQIALRFSQFFYLKEKLNLTPIFLMDDVFGELDSFRAEKISLYLGEIGQAFITMTDFSKLEKLNKSDNDLVFNVKNGKVAYA
ncbi:MAG: DNA replication and repair protein RecF [Ignavibacteriae bacterium]|nr:DNA replication and repair protein RecF [Ignavibacteriota bacterium]